MKKSVLFIAILFSIAGCEKTPQHEFDTYFKATINGEYLEFTGFGVGGDCYNWNYKILDNVDIMHIKYRLLLCIDELSTSNVYDINQLSTYFYIEHPEYKTYYPFMGEIQITELSNNRLHGLIEGKYVAAPGDTISITNGEFYSNKNF